MTPVLAMFIAAMCGPNVGCEMSYTLRRYCSQVPGQPEIKCVTQFESRFETCDYGATLDGMRWDFDGDRDVDLRDFAAFQNRGMR